MPGSSALPLNAPVRPALPATTAQSGGPGGASPLPSLSPPVPGTRRRRLPAVSPPEFPNCSRSGAGCPSVTCPGRIGPTPCRSP